MDVWIKERMDPAFASFLCSCLLWFEVSAFGAYILPAGLSVRDSA